MSHSTHKKAYETFLRDMKRAARNPILVAVGDMVERNTERRRLVLSAARHNTNDIAQVQHA